MFLQSIFSFNGADISGFDSFRKDFPNYKEVCLCFNFYFHITIVYALYMQRFVNMRIFRMIIVQDYLVIISFRIFFFEYLLCLYDTDQTK